MRFLASIILCFGFIAGFSQAKLGMSLSHTITPTNSTNALQGIGYGDSITVWCYVKNKGNSNYSGKIGLHRRVDTLNTPGIPGVVDSVIISGLTPGDSTLVMFKDTITPNNYKQGGNGNTIVVWPKAVNAPTMDSLRTIHVYVNNLAGINELTSGRLLVYPVPATTKLFFDADKQLSYDKIIIYNINMQKVKELKFSESIDISDLPPATYWINLTTRDNKRFAALIVKSE